MRLLLPRHSHTFGCKLWEIGEDKLQILRASPSFSLPLVPWRTEINLGKTPIFSQNGLSNRWICNGVGAGFTRRIQRVVSGADRRALPGSQRQASVLRAQCWRGVAVPTEVNGTRWVSIAVYRRVRWCCRRKKCAAKSVIQKRRRDSRERSHGRLPAVFAPPVEPRAFAFFARKFDRILEFQFARVTPVRR